MGSLLSYQSMGTTGQREERGQNPWEETKGGHHTHNIKTYVPVAGLRPLCAFSPFIFTKSLRNTYSISQMRKQCLGRLLFKVKQRISPGYLFQA